MSTSTRRALRFAVPAVLIAAAAAAVGAYQLLSSRGADVGLRVAELPGLTVAFPDWTVSETTDDWVAGVHRRDSPRGRGRFVSVRSTS